MESYKEFLTFSGNNFLYSLVIILVGFILGWLLYNYVILGKISLREALFEKDNLAAWIEFIGAFVFPTLYLAAKAVEGTTGNTLFADLSMCVLYLVIYMGIFTVLRLLSGFIVRAVCTGEDNCKISLNSEIYEQKNIAASLFSVALSIVFANLVSFFDAASGFFYNSLMQIADVLLFTLLAFIVYILILRRKTTLFKEIFLDNNVAAGAAFAGFIFAVETMLRSAVVLQTEFDLIDLAIYSAISLVIFGVLSWLFKVLFSRAIKVDIWNEVYEQNNIGAAIGQAALYIGIANVIIHFLK